jgi:hypothetical protein
LPNGGLPDGSGAGFALGWIHLFVMVASEQDKDAEKKSDP